MGNCGASFIAAGDFFITRHLPRGGYEGFDALRARIAERDVRFLNLEMTFHDAEGAPAAESGGTWAMAEPSMLDDARAFGFNLFNTANNHSGDYGEGGVTATAAHLRERGMAFAGTGANLGEASRACYLETPRARVALVGAASTFAPAARAGGQSGELRGRPGLNPLRFDRYCHVDAERFRRVQELAEATHVNARQNKEIRDGYQKPYPAGVLPLGKNLKFVQDERCFVESVPNAEDERRILAEVAEAKRQADIVLVSLHSHEYDGEDPAVPSMFQETFSRKCVDAGASAVVGHGHHELRGAELYRGGLILYGLGNFLFETETIPLQPADAYAGKGLPADVKVGGYMDFRSRGGTSGYGTIENVWRSVLAGWTVEDGKLTGAEFYPIELGMALPRSRKGTPRLSGDEGTLRHLAELSEPYGTRIEIENGAGRIRL